MQSVQVLPIKTIRKATVKLTHEMVRLARFACRIPDRSLWQTSLARIAVAAGLFMLVAGVRTSAQTPNRGKRASAALYLLWPSPSIYAIDV